MFDKVKVFSATKARDRQEMGERITEWLRKHQDGYDLVDTVIRQSSDREFHCLSFVLFLRTKRDDPG